MPGAGVRIDDMTLYPDQANAGVYYYPPGRLKLAMRPDGVPELSLIEIRYVGTAATGDQGKFVTRSAFTFRLVMEHRADSSLRSAASQLTGQLHRAVQLKPLPISTFDTKLLYTPIGGVPKDAGKGEAETLSEWSPTQFWTERVVTVYPDANTSQLLWELLKHGKAAMTVTYSFSAKGAQIEGEPKADSEFTAISDSIPISIDPEKNSGVLRKVDLNERSPANFPLLNVYCFDFKEERGGSVVERDVQIEATGVTGKSILALVKFRKGEPDVYSSKAKFPFAINMKKGYRFRVRDIQVDGDEKLGEWRQVDDWARILDVTTPAGGNH